MWTWSLCLDGDVHSPVRAEVRRSDGAGGRSKDLPCVGESRRSRWCLGEGRGGDRHQQHVPSEYLTWVCSHSNVALKICKTEMFILKIHE